MSSQTITRECSHCGNVALQILAHEHSALLLFDTVGEDNLVEDFDFQTYICSTCKGLNLYGGFRIEKERNDFSEYPSLYPVGSSLLPPSYLVPRRELIPRKLITMYQEIWHLKRRTPVAFVAQIRRALELICDEQNANGVNLASKLQSLTRKGVFPGYIGDLTDLLRLIGNIGAHDSTSFISVWDAESIDDFFRLLVEYVYVLPAKIEIVHQLATKTKKSATHKRPTPKASDGTAES